MDSTFFVGSAAFFSAVIIFCGSVWLLLTMLLGPRLAYMVTASITLGFVFILGLVWSYGTPLGPVGDLPEWLPVDIAAVGEPLDFGPAGQYPESPWAAIDPEDTAQTTQAGELGNAATGFLEESLDEIQTFESVKDAVVNGDSVRLLEQGGELYGAVTFDPLEVEDETDPLGLSPDAAPVGQPTVAVMQYDFGNPSKPARQITAGTFLVFVLHLFGLSRSEKKARQKHEANGNGTTRV